MLGAEGAAMSLGAGEDILREGDELLKLCSEPSGDFGARCHVDVGGCVLCF